MSQDRLVLTLGPEIGEVRAGGRTLSKHVQLIAIPEEAVRLAAYLSGDLDIISVERNAAPYAQRRSGIVKTFAKTTAQVLIFGGRGTPFENASTRIAFADALDRPRLALDWPWLVPTTSLLQAYGNDGAQQFERSRFGNGDIVKVAALYFGERVSWAEETLRAAAAKAGVLDLRSHPLRGYGIEAIKEAQFSSIPWIAVVPVDVTDLRRSLLSVGLRRDKKPMLKSWLELDLPSSDVSAFSPNEDGSPSDALRKIVMSLERESFIVPIAWYGQAWLASSHLGPLTQGPNATINLAALEAP
jgi:hypothetical protein